MENYIAKVTFDIYISAEFLDFQRIKRWLHDSVLWEGRDRYNFEFNLLEPPSKSLYCTNCYDYIILCSYYVKNTNEEKYFEDICDLIQCIQLSQNGNVDTDDDNASEVNEDLLDIELFPDSHTYTKLNQI